MTLRSAVIVFIVVCLLSLSKTQNTEEDDEDSDESEALRLITEANNKFASKWYNVRDFYFCVLHKCVK